MARNKTASYICMGACALVALPPLVVFLRLVYCGLALISCLITMSPSSFEYVKGDTAAAMQGESGSPSLIPQILHQTYKNLDIPSGWQDPRDSCQVTHPKWRYMFWTDESGREFIASNHTWFLPTYDSYPFNIQRVDALRYFLLLTYGGVYLDLDVGCRYPLDPLRKYSMVLPSTDPVGFSNDAMAAVPGHPLLQAMVKALPSWNHLYGSRYPTVMFSTGPMFLTLQYQRNPQAARSVAILPPHLYGGGWKAFLAHYEGNSWHGRDSAVIQWLYHHLVLVAIAGAGLGTGLMLVCCMVVGQKQKVKAKL